MFLSSTTPLKTTTKGRGKNQRSTCIVTEMENVELYVFFLVVSCVLKTEIQAPDEMEAATEGKA